MDAARTGRYIADKRRALGLTQRQLAEKLGMSDKSVSKWERGICMPDASVYMELCSILGISINEFFAGEDICPENLQQKSEDNLIQVSRENTHRQRKLKSVIAALVVISLGTVAGLGIVIYRHFVHPTDCITPIREFSAEVETVMLLSGIDDALLFEYSAGQQFRGLTVYLSRYENGTLMEKTSVANLSYQGMESPKDGLIALIPDQEKYAVQLILTGSGGKLMTEIPILEGVENRSRYGRGATGLESRCPIAYDAERGVAALVYGMDVVEVVGIGELGGESVQSCSEYIYYFSLEFSK